MGYYRNIFKEGELQEEVVCRKFRHTAQHGAIQGKTQEVETNYYNLDVIISVGYRVRSQQGTQFRIWATQEYKAYKEVQRLSAHEENLKEIEEDIKRLKGRNN